MTTYPAGKTEPIGGEVPTPQHPEPIMKPARGTPQNRDEAGPLGVVAAHAALAKASVGAAWS